MTTVIPGKTIELTYDELHAAQDLADNGIEVRVHYTNWPGTPSTPARVLPHGDENGNIEYETRAGGTSKLFAMPDELSVVARAGLEVRPGRQLSGPRPMFAFVTRQGTAMAETAVCAVCLVKADGAMHAQRAAQRSEDWDGKALHKCTGNENLSCIVCGSDT